MTKIARNCQNFDKFCAIFCIFKFCRLSFYFSVFIKISPFFFRIPHYDKTNTTPQQLRINERACGFDDTYYTQHTYNFVHADNVPREIFTQRGFDYSVSLENHLF